MAEQTRNRLEKALESSVSRQTLALINPLTRMDSRMMTASGFNSSPAAAAVSVNPLLSAASAQHRADAAMVNLLLAQRQAAVSSRAALAGSLDASTFETALLMDLAQKSGSLVPFVAHRPPVLSMGGVFNNGSILGPFPHLGALSSPLPGNPQVQALVAARAQSQQQLIPSPHPFSAFSQVNKMPQEELKNEEACDNKRKSDNFSSSSNDIVRKKKLKTAKAEQQVPSLATSLTAFNDASVDADKPKRKRRQYRHESFVCRLHRIVTQMEAEGRTDIISFNEDGGGFFLHQPDIFEKEIMPNYFRGRKFCTFRRQLTSYGFSRLRTGGAYRNPHFVRGRPDLCDDIIRDKRYDEQE